MKIKIILLAIFIILLSYYIKFNTQSTKTNLTKSTQNTTTQLIDFEKVQERQEELKRLQNPQLIENSLRQIGKLTTLEGQYNYTDTITDNGLFGITLRQIHINYLYKYGLGINLEDIKVAQIVNSKIVYLKIPKEKIKLFYVQLVGNQSSITDGKNFILASQFKPSEIQMINNNCQEATANMIGTSQSYFELAEKNLESELDKFIKSLGYSQVIYL